MGGLGGYVDFALHKYLYVAVAKSRSCAPGHFIFLLETGLRVDPRFAGRSGGALPRPHAYLVQDCLSTSLFGHRAAREA